VLRGRFPFWIAEWCPFSQLGFSPFAMRDSLTCSLFCFYLNLFSILAYLPYLEDQKTLKFSSSLTILTLQLPYYILFLLQFSRNPPISFSPTVLHSVSGTHSLNCSNTFPSNKLAPTSSIFSSNFISLYKNYEKITLSLIT